jgi:hypothetical protein
VQPVDFGLKVDLLSTFLQSLHKGFPIDHVRIGPASSRLGARLNPRALTVDPPRWWKRLDPRGVFSASSPGGSVLPIRFPEDLRTAIAFREATAPTFIEVVSAALLRDGLGVQMFLTHNGQNMTICLRDNGGTVKALFAYH